MDNDHRSSHRFSIRVGERKITSSYKLKILMCGSKGVGKEEMLTRVSNPIAQEASQTTGVYIFTKDIKVGYDSICTLSIWDIKGQKDLAFVRSIFCKGATGAIFMFDLSRAATYDEVKKWRAEVKQFSGDIPFILVGNRLELLTGVGEVIDRNEARRDAEDQGAYYIERQSSETKLINQALEALTKRIIGK